MAIIDQLESIIPVMQIDASDDLPQSQSSHARKIELFFSKHKAQLLYVHIVMAAIFLTLIFLPVFLPEPSEQAGIFEDITLFSNFLMWGLWFPLVLLSVLFSGRSWCGLLCPMGAASEWANNHGLQKNIPNWVRWPGTPVVSFILITVWGQTVGVRDHPEAIALVFGSTLLAAIILGFFYGKNKRAWCRHMCPIGLLLGVFSRLSIIQFTPKAPKPGGDLYTEKGLCPTMININRKQESRHCIECFRCVNPHKKGGLMLQIRPLGEEVENIAQHNANASEVWFFFLAIGSAIGGFLWLVLPEYQQLRHEVGSWFVQHGWYWIGDSGPAWLMSVHPERREVFNWLDFIMIISFMLSAMLILTTALATLTYFSAYLSGKLGGIRSTHQRFIELAYQYMPIALISLVIGLGGELFEVLQLIGFSEKSISVTKGSLFFMSLLWSLYLGDRILYQQQVVSHRWLALIPGVIGSCSVGWLWFIAIF